MIETPVVRQNLLAIEALQKAVEELKERITELEEPTQDACHYPEPTDYKKTLRILEGIEAKGKERDELLSTLRRYVKLEERFGFGIDEIYSIVLKPVGRVDSLSGDNDQIIYDSHVTLKNGKKYVFEGIDLKKLIDGEEP